MGYLRLHDYFNLRIQESLLNTILQNNDFVRRSCELEGTAEMISYLVQRYDVNQEFKDLNVFSVGGQRLAGYTFELNADDYSATSTYSIGTLVCESNSIYVNKIAILVGEAFTLSKWTYVGEKNELISVGFPFNKYSYSSNYSAGEVVYYNGKIYKCLSDCINILPTTESVYWSVGITYAFSDFEIYSVATTWNNLTNYNAGDKCIINGVNYYAVVDNVNEIPTDNITKWLPIYWLRKDLRSIQLVAFLIDIVLYKIHMRIAPNNIPKLRIDSYQYAIDWLKEAGGQNNAITADIPLLQPRQGARIRWGSNQKNINTY